MSWFNGRSNGKHASMRIQPPLARTEALIVEELDGEVLVYDELNARAHCLNATAAGVWRACNGHTTIEEVAAQLELDVETVGQALAELESNGLLDGLPISNGNGSTRREFSRRAVQVGAGVAGATMISSILAPTAMAAVTPTIGQCLQYSALSCDGCDHICGCCCCCQGCSTATTVSACKICLPIGLCDASPAYFASGCSQFTLNGAQCSSGPNCSVGPNRPQNPCAPPYPTSPPSGAGTCCIPACFNNQPTLTECKAGGGTACGCAGLNAGSPCT